MSFGLQNRSKIWVTECRNTADVCLCNFNSAETPSQPNAEPHVFPANKIRAVCIKVHLISAHLKSWLRKSWLFAGDKYEPRACFVFCSGCSQELHQKYPARCQPMLPNWLAVRHHNYGTEKQLNWPAASDERPNQCRKIYCV